MACTHSAGCPLFPLLNASLDSWRRYYCDSDNRWRECARYQQALRGQHVPLSLLPNGSDALHIEQVVQRKRSESGGGEPVVARPAPGSRPPRTPKLTDLLFEQATGPIPSGTQSTSPMQLHERSPRSQLSPRPLAPPSASGWPAQQATNASNRWWNRLAEWIRKPA